MSETTDVNHEMNEIDTTEATNDDAEPDTQTTETEAPEETPEVGSDGKTSREAAKWRTKFRDAETQIAAMTEHVTTLQRQLVDQAIAKRITDPSDFWTQANIADLLADDGTLDPDRIDAKIAEVLAAKPHWTKRASAAAPTTDVGSGFSTGKEEPKSFIDAFKPRG